MQDFAVMGDFLKTRYDKALLVGMNQDATTLQAQTKSRKKVRKSDMVYMEESPDYCLYNPSFGE